MKEAWEDRRNQLDVWMTKNHTDPDIQDCIMAALAQRQPTSFAEHAIGGEAQEAATAQDRIGWHNFLEGKVATAWATRQERYYILLNAPHRFSAAKWLKSLVSEMLLLTHHLWVTRCGIIHEKESNGLSREEATKLQNEINEQFVLGKKDLLPCDRYLIERGKPAVTGLSARDQKSWLADVKLARRDADTQYTSDDARMRRAMQEWLQTT